MRSSENVFDNAFNGTGVEAGEEVLELFLLVFLKIKILF
jgi:hypothetical protein